MKSTKIKIRTKLLNQWNWMNKAIILIKINIFKLVLILIINKISPKPPKNKKNPMNN